MDNNALMQKVLDAINTRFDAVDKRLDAIDKRFDAVDQRLDAMDKRFDAVDQRFDAMDKRLDAIEGTVKATQLAVNELAEDVKDIKTHLRFHDLKFMEQEKKIYKLEGRN
jgi:archaellum component FlaC